MSMIHEKFGISGSESEEIRLEFPVKVLTPNTELSYSRFLWEGIEGAHR